MARLITLTGPSGSGKSKVIEELLALKSESFSPELIPKYSTRAPRKDDGDEIICVPTIPHECDLVYEQYGGRYGIELQKIYDLLSRKVSPIVILNDVRTIADIKNAFGGLAHSLFIFREGPKLHYFKKLTEERGVNDESDTLKRFEKAQSIYRIYIENIHLFDHVILNSGTLADLQFQVAQLVKGIVLESKWHLNKRGAI
ncbi:MAG TPA: hypothetical protein VK469_14550 [Candidatus Kapabacteria bacterium]|nr:hypothetical protein [Candidatus Kapabacteria bacterium]